MIVFLRALWSPVPNYRIRTAPGGYVAEHRDKLGLWWMLRRDGRSGSSRDVLADMPERYVCSTEDEAGRRINLHSASVSGKIVWDDVNGYRVREP